MQRVEFFMPGLAVLSGLVLSGTAPAADDVVIAQHEAVAVQQSNAEGPRILYTVVGDPYRLSQEP